MDAFSAASVWVKGMDGRGVNCWRNTYTGRMVYSDPERVLTAGPNPNVRQFTENGADESPWEEYFDLLSNNPYWYNRVTKETTWKDPNEPAKPQPPPPKVEKREQDQWFKVDDAKKGKVWYNAKTEKYQRERPACLRKYR